MVARKSFAPLGDCDSDEGPVEDGAAAGRLGVRRRSCREKSSDLSVDRVNGQGRSGEIYDTCVIATEGIV